jgi:hypothetical protein
MRYLLYVGFMGSLSGVVGWCADISGMVPIITLILFSAISLVCGFIFQNSLSLGMRNENLFGCSSL